MWSTLSFLNTYWQWIMIAVVATGGLAYAAFITRNWKFIVAAGAILALYVSHQWTYSAGFKAKERQVQEEIVKIIKERDNVIAEVKGEDAKRAAADAQRIAELEKKINATPKNTRPSLPRASAGRVRDVR
jgi:membrane protein implicated in regulation of membrane protease activity